MKLINQLKCIAAVGLFAITSSAMAQAMDVWTKGFLDQGLFTAHIDNCDTSTEVFIPMGPATNLGFCLEKNERSAAAWEIAREGCSAVQKRLPEVAEYKFACKSGISGLNNLTDDTEWASNFPIIVYGDSVANQYVLPSFGNGSCTAITTSTTGHASAAESSLPYRCVR